MSIRAGQKNWNRLPEPKPTWKLDPKSNWTERFILLGPKFFHPKKQIRTRPKPEFKNTQIFYPKI